MPLTVIPDVGSLKTFVGKPLGPSGWVEVSQERIDAFATATGDRQWIHCDPERARKESPFGGPVAHGFLTLSLLPSLLDELVRVEKVRLTVNYGLDRLRLPAPVPAGARVRLTGTLDSVRDMPGGGARALYRLRVEVEGVRKPACLAHAVLVYFP